MKKRILAILLAVCMVGVLFAGCGDDSTSKKKKKKEESGTATQFAVAVNPVFTYDDGTAVVAFNDVKNAVKSDRTDSTLASLYNDTAWQWSYALADSGNWKSRATYGLDAWVNGAGVEASKAYAYSFTDDGKTSLMPYTASSTKLTTYNGDIVPEYGVVLSGTAGEEEALTYTVLQDGKLSMPAGSFVALKAIGGAETGFLEEDGNPRIAAVRVLVNDQQIFSGTMTNSTGSADGVAITSLEYDKLGPVDVKAGDMVFISVKLNAQTNSDEDVTVPPVNEAKNYKTVMTETKQLKENKGGNAGQSNLTISSDIPLSVVSNYELRFAIVRDTNIDLTYGDGTLKMISSICNSWESTLQAEVKYKTAYAKSSDFEFVFGVVDSRPESIKLDEELHNYRANNAYDYLVRRVEGKIYFVAGSRQALEQALTRFANEYLKDDTGVIPPNFAWEYRPEYANIQLNGNNIGQYVIRVEKHCASIVYKAAESLQLSILASAGFNCPIVRYANGTAFNNCEIQIGPMNDSLRFYRIDPVSGNRNTKEAYETRFTADESDTYMAVDTDGLLDVGDLEYRGSLNGNIFSLNGGTSYAIASGVEAFAKDMVAQGNLASGYTLSGKYDYKNDPYSLAQGYALTLTEEFNYDDEEVDSESIIRKKWSISDDTTTGPDGAHAPDQRRPGIYGENWWIWTDSTGNGYAAEITKWEPYGYDAGRLISMNKWAVRYFLWETRIVMGTHNGACSAIWASSASPDNPPSFRNEIDVYENYGKDGWHACLHTWQATAGYLYYGTDGHANHAGTGQMSVVRVVPGEGDHFYDTFHDCSCEWEHDYITILLDGAEVQKVPTTDDTMRSFWNSTTIKYANGVGTGGYAGGSDPFDWMGGQEGAKKFFEVQLVDYCHIYQKNPENMSKEYKPYIKYVNKTVEKNWLLSNNFDTNVF